jgi:putative ABC transport system permease protein
LSQDFFKLVLIGGVIGIPVIYVGLTNWLERYAYQMPINLSLFIFPVSIVALLTMLTISFQTIAAAKVNPTECMKSE